MDKSNPRSVGLPGDPHAKPSGVRTGREGNQDQPQAAREGLEVSGPALVWKDGKWIVAARWTREA